MSEEKAEYDALEPGFSLLREFLQVRRKAGLSQIEIADRMDTKSPHRYKHCIQHNTKSLKTWKK